MERTILLTPRMLCSVSVRVLHGRPCLTFAEQTRAWNEVARHSPPSAGRPGPAGAGQEEHLLLQRNAFAVGLHHATFARLRVSVCIWSQNVRRLDASLPLRLLFPAGL